MAEICPLSDRSSSHTRPGDIAGICRIQCEEKWERTETMPLDGPYDFYEPEKGHTRKGSECTHSNSSLEYSSDGLRKIGNTPVRAYVIVDECGSCGTEFGEQGYLFECPYN